METKKEIESQKEGIGEVEFWCEKCKVTQKHTVIEVSKKYQCQKCEFIKEYSTEPNKKKIIIERNKFLKESEKTLEELKELNREAEKKFYSELKNVTKVEYQPLKYNQKGYMGYPIGAWASIRPNADEYKNKTFLGIYLGDLPYQQVAAIKNKTTLEISHGTNPAIYVPDLKKTIFGYESWWGIIKDKNSLKKITDADIENVWYVKALKELTKE